MKTICSPVDSTCDECFEMSLTACSVANIDASLTPSTAYWLQVIDKFRTRQPAQSFTSAVDGSFNLTEPVTGLFTKYSGKFTIHITTDQAGTNKVNMTFDGNAYDCLVVDFEG